MTGAYPRGVGHKPWDMPWRRAERRRGKRRWRAEVADEVRLTPCDLDGGFVAERLDLPGSISQGETEEEALANADAADEWLAVDAREDLADLTLAIARMATDTGKRTSLVEYLATGRDLLTPEEAEEMAEAECQHHLGMSVAEFKAAAEAGTLPRLSVVPHLVALTGAIVNGPSC